MKAVKVESIKRPARVIEIDNTLRALQSEVDGYIEVIHPFDNKELALICDEEGRLKGKPISRWITPYGICGSFLIVATRYEDEEFSSLTDDEVVYILEHINDDEVII